MLTSSLTLISTKAMLKTILEKAFGFFIGAFRQYENAVNSMPEEDNYVSLEKYFSATMIYSCMVEMSNKASALSLGPVTAKKRRFAMEEKRDLLDLFIDA